MKIEEVPELTLPIIKPNRDYFCQYCDKVCKEVTPQRLSSVLHLYAANLSLCRNIWQELQHFFFSCEVLASSIPSVLSKKCGR